MWPASGQPGFGQPQQLAGAAPPASAVGFAGFGQLQQPNFRQPQQLGFSQPPAGFNQPAGFGQPAAGGFGSQQQMPALTGGFATFGQAAPAHFAQEGQAAGGFAFGQQQQPAAGPAMQMFGQQPAAGPATQAFGQQPAQPGSFTVLQQPTGFAQPASGFTFGGQQQQAAQPGFASFGQQAAATPAPAQQYTPGQFTFGKGAQQAEQQGTPGSAGGGAVKFSFGSAQRKKPGKPPAAVFTAAEQAGEDEGEQMDEAALAAAKAAALASMPKFGGAAARPTAAKPAAAPPPPPRVPRRGAGGAGAAGGKVDAEEEARRAQRASRFGAPPAASAAPAAAPAPAPAAPPAALSRPASAAGSAFSAGGGMGEDAGEDDEGEGGMRAGAIVGTCEEMCPAPERERRSRLSDIQIFERPDPNNAALTSPELAVKRFARTIDESNNAPEFFRTRGALARTMQYLRNLLDRQAKQDARLGLIHKFLWDRYRSVRQDLYIQGMDDEFSVNIFEEVVRFHLLSEHELCEEEASITEMEGFNSHLNMEQMNKALISLNDMYNKLAAAGRPARNEAEFRAYHLLGLMGQHGKFKGDQQAFLSMLQAMRPEVRGSSPIQWVLKLQRAFAANNFVRFFTLVRQAPYLLACLSHVYFGQVRGRALRALADTVAPKADTPAAIELSWLVDALMLDSLGQAQQLCTMHGYETGIQGGVPVALMIKGAYVDPPPPVPRKRSELITSMAPATRSLAVTTPALPPMSAEEAARMEQQRQEALQRLREGEALRTRQAEEEQRQCEAAAAGAAAEEERRRKEAEAARLVEEERRRKQEQLAELQRQQALLQQQQEEERRRREEEERQRQQILLQQQQETERQRQQILLQQQQETERQRLLAEQRLAEQRRREAEELERQRRLVFVWLAALEAERRRQEEERRRLAELERQRQQELRRLEARAEQRSRSLAVAAARAGATAAAALA
ncbi:hypothetical protein ABPG75_000073 [Micractinium tetrahymenae]